MSSASAETNNEAKPTNIVLTGFMGTGKTTVGRIVAAVSGTTFVDTDAVIEMRHGPIPEIFEHRGEAHFRALERDLALQLAQRSNLVIATGGGMLVDPVNADTLAATGRVFCLVADEEEMLQRVLAEVSDDDAPDRPLLDHPDPPARLRELLEQRRSAYERFDQVDTSGRAPVEIAQEILDRV